MELLAADNLCKRYGALTVIDRLGFALAPGAALGIIGPNGAGKSTLFNLIAGTVRADTGRVTFDGHDITRQPAHRRCRAGIARSYQIPHPFAGMTVFENLLVGASYGGGMRERDSYAPCVELLEITGLAGKANRLAGTLTLLERKRLELARAVATRPRLLLLDEIAGGLTEPEVKELVVTIRDIKRSGISLIWIEHIVHALLPVVDRLMVISAGRKLADGEPRAVMGDAEVQRVFLGLAPA